MKHSNKQAGFSLLEIAMVAGIIVVLSVLAIVGYQAAKQSTDLAKAVTNVNALTASIRNSFSSQGDYTDLSNKIVVSSNTLPDNMRVTGDATSIRSPWSTAGFVVAPAQLQTKNDAFTITANVVPARACQDLVSQVFRNYESVAVGGTTVTSVASAQTACTGTGTKTIVFTAR
ncbi:type 4 pilus major pilin [Pseudomonas luteola]